MVKEPEVADDHSHHDHGDESDRSATGLIGGSLKIPLVSKCGGESLLKDVNSLKISPRGTGGRIQKGPKKDKEKVFDIRRSDLQRMDRNMALSRSL